MTVGNQGGYAPTPYILWGQLPSLPTRFHRLCSCYLYFEYVQWMPLKWATLFPEHFGPINWLNQMGEFPVQHNKINITTNDNDNARTRKKKSSLLIKLAWVVL